MTDAPRPEAPEIALKWMPVSREAIKAANDAAERCGVYPTRAVAEEMLRYAAPIIIADALRPAAGEGEGVDGWQLVPKEPDKAMGKAGRKKLCEIADRMEMAKLTAVSSIDFWQRVGHLPANEVFAAMLSAAPKPPVDHSKWNVPIGCENESEQWKRDRGYAPKPPQSPSLALAEFDTTRFCCFCGKDNTSGIVGYAGERTCPHCGKGGHGEPDEPQMAYKRNLGASPTVIEDFPGRKVEAHLRLFGKLPTVRDKEASDLTLAEENRVLREALAYCQRLFNYKGEDAASFAQYVKELTDTALSTAHLSAENKP